MECLLFANPRFGLQSSGICLFITSTFGNGDPPKMAEGVAELIDRNINLNDRAMDQQEPL
jgi:sulfite reductase alpha subunit-like flavoprotein